MACGYRPPRYAPRRDSGENCGGWRCRARDRRGRCGSVPSICRSGGRRRWNQERSDLRYRRFTGAASACWSAAPLPGSTPVCLVRTGVRPSRTRGLIFCASQRGHWASRLPLPAGMLRQQGAPTPRTGSGDTSHALPKAGGNASGQPGAATMDHHRSLRTASDPVPGLLREHEGDVWNRHPTCWETPSSARYSSSVRTTRFGFFSQGFSRRVVQSRGGAHAAFSSPWHRRTAVRSSNTASSARRPSIQTRWWSARQSSMACLMDSRSVSSPPRTRRTSPSSSASEAKRSPIS